MIEREADVAVVGAGLAGLSAARAIADAGREVVVVEARDRVGGRVLNRDIGDGQVLEVGGQWIGPTQHRVAALAAELGVETYPTHGEGEHLIEWRGKARRYTGTIPRISVPVLLDVARAIRRIDRMAADVPVEAPWEAPRARDWDSQTFATWMRRNTITGGARELLEMGIEAVWAQQPEDVSLLHVLFYVASAGGSLDTLLSTEGGAQAARCVGGTQLIAIRLAERLGAERLLLDQPVRRIEWSEGDAVVHADGARVRARRVIVAMPPVMTARIAYDPPLPGYRDQLTQHMPQGSVWKCMAIYDQPFWRADGLTGQATSDRGPARIVFDNSPPSGSPGVLLGFLEGRFARELGRLPERERRAQVVDGFARLFGPRAAEPRDYIERGWAEDEWSRGCYGCSFTTGGWTAYGPALREPVGPVHWAGAETATVWNGYMDGAVQSGERAANEALERLSG